MKIMNILFKNLGLKILAAVLAVIIWIAITNTQDPDITKTYSIPVTITNTDSIEALGKTYEVLNNSDIMTISVTASRSVIEGLSESDFTAIANMQNIDDSLSYVPITVSASRYENQITISSLETYLEVSVENVIAKTYEVEYLQSGTLAANCEISEVEMSPDRVEVSGPESIMNQIERAAVYVDVESLGESRSADYDIKLLNAQDTEVATDRLTLSRNICTVDLSVMMRKDVSITLVTSGTPADGYVLGEVTPSPTRITLYGSPDKLSEMDELVVDSTKLSLDNRTSDFTVTIDLAEFLPSGISFADESDGAVTVTVEILEEEAVAVEILEEEE